MNTIKLFLSIASISCLLLLGRVHSQGPDGHPDVRAIETRFKLTDAEIEVKMHELKHAMSERAVAEGTVEVEKFRIRVAVANDQSSSREMEHAKLELRQAEIRLEMQKLQAEMASLETERAKARLQLIRALVNGKPDKPAQVRLEYVDDLDVVIIRGAKESVDKVKALIETAETAKKKKQ